jgi:hypothetical protein
MDPSLLSTSENTFLCLSGVGVGVVAAGITVGVEDDVDEVEVGEGTADGVGDLGVRARDVRVSERTRNVLQRGLWQ